ncbi:MAG TPA: hypothetical protein DHV21_14605 [Curvibacter sp.]|nr:hypothetical protein [Curvibacter sp.]
MKTAAPALVTFLNTARQALQFDLWTFTLASGTVYRWTDADVDIKIDTRTFTRSPIITRDKVKWTRGIEVGQLKATLSGPVVLVDGQPLPAFSAAGGFDAASVALERVYLNDAGVVQGTLVWFTGVVADVLPSRMGCELVVKSPLTQLNQQTPRNLYQAGCLNDLYDSNCALNRAAHTVTGTVSAVAAGNNPALTVTLATAVPARWAELGVLRFTTGANAGLGRTVQIQAGVGTGLVLQFSRPYPFAVTVGDAFTLTAGCDKAVGTCQSKFANLLRFRGQPYIPVPETVT